MRKNYLDQRQVFSDKMKIERRMVNNVRNGERLSHHLAPLPCHFESRPPGEKSASELSLIIHYTLGPSWWSDTTAAK